MSTDTSKTINVDERNTTQLLEHEITEILTAMQEEESSRVSDTVDTDIFAEDILITHPLHQSDPIITPAEPTTDLEIGETLEDLDSEEDTRHVEAELRILNKLLERVDRVLRQFAGRPNGLQRLTHQSHSLVLEGAEVMELNLATSDTHFIHTTPNSYGFVHVRPGPVNASEPARHDFSIINKGAGFLLLIMHNRVRGEEIRWHKFLEPYQKCDLSIINDGNDTILC